MEVVYIVDKIRSRAKVVRPVPSTTEATGKVSLKGNRLRLMGSTEKVNERLIHV